MMFRIVPALLALSLVGAKGGCFEELIAEMRFVNSTGSDLCVSLNVSDPDCRTDIKAHTTARWHPECAKQQSITVVISVRETGTVIYRRTEPCIDWEDADATFIIKRLDGEYVVTDSMPAEP